MMKKSNLFLIVIENQVFLNVVTECPHILTRHWLRLLNLVKVLLKVLDKSGYISVLYLKQIMLWYLHYLGECVVEDLLNIIQVL